MGFKADGTRCNRQETGFIHLDANHLHYCSIHWPVYTRRVHFRERLTVVVAEQHHRPGTCHKWVANERWCGNDCGGGHHLLCVQHRVAHNQRVQRARRQEEQDTRRNNAFAFYRDHQPRMNWRQVIDHIWQEDNTLVDGDRFVVARRFFWHNADNEPGLNSDWQFDLYWDWNRAGRVGQPPDLTRQHIHQAMPVPPPVIQRGLHAIARDPQNVHTRAVSEQTNAGLDKLLSVLEADKILRTPDWIAARWLVKSYGRWNHVVRVVNDMQHWYAMPTCKTVNDHLYRRALDGLYILIRRMPDRDIQEELFKRAFEECYESVGMCCEGHISRLCNVLVGFDDAFAPPVPFGEILQNKMAAIYAMEVDTEEKIRQATAFFNEFAVPEAERSAWLEAF